MLVVIIGSTAVPEALASTIYFPSAKKLWLVLEKLLESTAKVVSLFSWSTNKWVWSLNLVTLFK